MTLKRSTISISLILTISSTAFSWNWGSEVWPNNNESCVWQQPQGLAGGKWFNVENGWVTEKPIKFFNWDKERPFPGSAWCFEGALSTIQLYYQWPERSFLNGYWTSTSEPMVRIEHTWDYSSLKMSNDQYGNPSIEPLAFQNIPGYSMGSNEIGRLFATQMIATGALGDRAVICYGDKRLYHVVKNLLGFTNAKTISATDANLESVLQTELNAGRPVIMAGSSHVWNIDAYKSEGHLYHILENFYNHLCPYFHRSRWKDTPRDPIAKFVIYNLDPTITVPAYGTQMITFNYGDNFIALTSNKTFTKRIRMKNIGTNLTNIFNVTLSDISKTYYNNLQCKFVEYGADLALPPFTFSVGQANMLTLTITNSSSRPITMKLVFDDVAPSCQPSFDADRLADLLYTDQTGAISVNTSTGRGFWGSGTATWVPTYGYGSDISSYFPADFNGDGLTDLGYFSSDNYFWVALSKAGGFDTPQRWIGPNPSGWGAPYVGDFNGDGKADLMFFDSQRNAVYISISTGSAFWGTGSGEWITSNGFGSQKANYFVADFNGDGKTDLGYRENDFSVRVTLSTGSGFQKNPQNGLIWGTQWIPPYTFGDSYGSYYLGDFNGDRKVDLMFFKSSTNRIDVTTATESSFGGSGSGTWISSFWGNLSNNFLIADYNGDGSMDLGYCSGDNSLYVYLSTKTNFFGSGSGQWIGPNGWVTAGGKYYVSNCLNKKP
jgi:hypothetical protein